MSFFEYFTNKDIFLKKMFTTSHGLCFYNVLRTNVKINASHFGFHGDRPYEQLK